MFMLCVAPASCSSMFCSALDQTAGVSVQYKYAMESGRMARDILHEMGQQYSMKKCLEGCVVCLKYGLTSL